jgi:hypothetical protein
MALNNNSASRLYDILSLASKQSSNESCFIFWSNFFKISKEDGNERAYETVGLIRLLLSEVDETRRKMKGTQFSEAVYDDALNVVKKICSVEHLYNAWEHFRPSLTKDVLLSIRVCAEALPNEEEQIDADELTTLSKEIDELWKNVEEQQLPDELKAFVFRQLELIKKAIREYPVVGLRAFSNAEREMMLHYAMNVSIVKENSSKPEVQKLGKIWGKIKKFIDEFGKILKLLKDANDVYDIGGKFLN